MPSLETIRSIFKSSPLASIIFYPDAPVFTIAEVNEAFLIATKTNRKDLIGKGIVNAFPDDTNGKKKIKESIQQALLLRKVYKTPLQRNKLLNGSPAGSETSFWNFETYPVYDENDKVQFIVQNVIGSTDKALPLKEDNTLNNKLLLDSKFNFNDYPDAIFTLDIKGNFLSANKIMADMAECTQDELLRSSFISFVAPEDLEKTSQFLQNIIKGEIINFDVCIKTAKGNSRNFNITNLPIIINEEVIGLYGISRDITPVKEAEQKLKKYNKQIENIVENFTDGFFTVDRDWTVTYWNKKAERILLKNRNDILGKSLWDAYPDVISLKFYSELKMAMDKNISVHFEEYYLPFKIWVEVNAYPLEDGLSIYFKDISKRRNIENEIRQEKEKYLNLFNLSPLPQWVFDIETLRFLDVNIAAIKHYGYSKEEFLSMTIRDIRPPEDPSILEQLLQTSKPDGSFSNREVKHLKKSGEIIDVNVKGNAIPFEGRNARLVLATDITEKIKIEQALIKSEQRFKALVQDGSDLIAILNEKGDYLYVSPTSKTILDLDAEHLIGKNTFDFIHDDDKEMVITQFNLLSVNKHIELPPFRFKDNNQNWRWMQTVITDMSDDPVVAGIIANSRDVTQQIENENKIKAGLDLYNTVSQATSDTIYDWNLLTNEILWNKGIQGVFGYDGTDSSAYEWWHSKIHPDDIEDLINDIYRSIKKKRSKWKGEYRFQDSEGTYRNVFDRGFLIYDEHGAPVRMIGAMQDITERVNYIRAIEDHNKKLREIAWFQSHVVRAPLVRIMGLISLLKNYPDDIYPPDMLEHILTSAHELDEVIRSIVERTSEVEKE